MTRDSSTDRAASAVDPRRSPAAFALVFAGGAIGGLLRLGIDAGFAANPAWEIVAINVLGSFAFGVLAGRLERTARPLLSAFAGAGVLGGFTTFSALAAFAWNSPDASLNVAVLIATTAAAVLAATLGWALGTRAHGAAGDDPTPATAATPAPEAGT